MGTIPASENVFPLLELAEGAAPSTPATGQVRLYVKSDGLLYWKDDAGTEYAVGQGDTAAHLADTADAHDASAISFSPTGSIAATDVQAAIAEVAVEAGAGGGVAAGTANPGSPATGDLFFRTNIHGGMLIFYDGTRWLSHQMFMMSAPSSTTGAAQTATYGFVLGGPFGTYDLFLERLAVSSYTATTQSGTQYWTFQVEKNVLNTYVAVGSAVSTISLAADDWVLLTTDIDTVVTLATYAMFRVLATKVSTPGGNTAGVTLYYRLVIT